MGSCVCYTRVFLHQRTHLRTHSLQILHVCIYVYMCVCACICMWMRMCVYDIAWHVEVLLLGFSICTYVGMCMCLYVFVHVCVYSACVYVCICINVCLWTCMHIHLYAWCNLNLEIISPGSRTRDFTVIGRYNYQLRHQIWWTHSRRSW